MVLESLELEIDETIALLREVENDPLSDEPLQALMDTLLPCGKVFQETYDLIPNLVEVIRSWPLENAARYVQLIGRILRICCVEPAHGSKVDAAVSWSRDACKRILANSELEESDATGLLTANAALQYDWRAAAILDELCEGGSCTAECTKCNRSGELYLEGGQPQFSIDEQVVPVDNTSPKASLPVTLSTSLDLATSNQWDGIAEGLNALRCTVVCPLCRHTMPAIAAIQAGRS